MGYVAKAKYVRISPRKARDVALIVRGQNVNKALDILHFTRRVAAEIISKVLKSAVANAVNLGVKNVDSLYIEEIKIDEGPMLKRFRPVSRGRAHRILKKMSHISVSLEEYK